MRREPERANWQTTAQPIGTMHLPACPGLQRGGPSDGEGLAWRGERGARHRALTPALTGVVIRYCGYAERSSSPVTFRELPCTYVPVIIDLDAGWSIADGRRPERPAERLGSFVAGLTDGPVLVEHAGSARCLQVDLAPLAARRLLGLPMSELANRSVALEDVLGRRPASSSSGWPRHRAGRRGSRWSTGRLRRAWPRRRPWTRGRLVARAPRAQRRRHGHRRARGRARLEPPPPDRPLRDALGLPPKLVARIIRLERLTGLLAADAEVGWARAAAACGFFDQAHLAREVRDLAGVTPTELRALGVNSVQDEAAFAA